METISWLEALILGIVQGLTEYLPVSSSGHLAIGQALFGMQSGEDKLAFTVLLHIATVLSTLVVLWREVVWLFSDLFKFRWNEGTRYTLNILISMIPVGIVGLLFKDWVEAFFGEGLLLVGICLLITALLLAFSHFARPRQRESLSPWHAFVIGLAQAVAVLPGLSRSGSTIATGLLLGNRKETLAQFSFLMVIPPILGEALLDIKEVADTGLTAALGGISPTAALIGFVAAFVVGCLACRWMIDLVKKGRLIWFAVYCAVVGLATILIPLFL